MLYLYEISYIDINSIERKKTIRVKTYERLLVRIRAIKKVSLQKIKVLLTKDLTTKKIYDIM